MILVQVFRDNEEIKKIEVKGHSGYDEIGKDIVCSSVSTALILTINLLEKLNVKISYKEDPNIPLISLIINESDSLCQTILENLVNSLNDISSQYKKYLQIKTNF
jgi:uncharacterized protein YsxB (DUF464 family)